MSANRERTKFRVLHVVGGLNVGGTETWLSKGMRVIDRDRYRFDFLVFGNGPQFYQAEVEAFGARVFTCPPPTRCMGFAREFLRILRARRYHAVDVHVHCASGLVLALAAQAGIRCRIFHSHTAQDDSRRGWPRSLYFKFSRGLIQRNASRGVAVSHEAATPFFPADWQQHPDRWRIAPAGIDLSAFGKSCARDAVRRELDISINGHVVAHVGRFYPVKNHRFLLEIVRAMVATHPAVIFLFVGDGPERAYVTQLAERLGVQPNTRFVGVRHDVPRLLQACDAFVLPSLYEGFPLAYVEAQAAGLPCVIASSITSAADFERKRLWRLSVSRPAREWAEALQVALSLPRKGEIPVTLREVSVERSMERLLECYR